MKLSKNIYLLPHFAVQPPTLAIQNSTSSSGEQKWQWKIHKTFEKFILLVAVFGYGSIYGAYSRCERCDFWLCQW